MIVPPQVRPGTKHLLADDCPCGLAHEYARPVIGGPAGRWSDVHYVTTGDLYQQVLDIHPPFDVHVEVPDFEVVRTVGTIG